MRPILARGSEHASVLSYFVAPTSEPFFIRVSDLCALDVIGHWFGAVFNRQLSQKKSISIFDLKTRDTLKIDLWV